MKYAVVGFGTAGYHAVKKIRELDKEGCIDVYSNTGRAPYNPMLTTYYAFGKLEYEGMFPFGDLEQIQKEVDFNLRKETVIKVHGSEHPERVSFSYASPPLAREWLTVRRL